MQVESYTVVLHDELPKVGSGRRCVLAEVGRKWAVITNVTTGERGRMARIAWAGIIDAPSTEHHGKADQKLINKVAALRKGRGKATEAKKPEKISKDIGAGRKAATSTERGAVAALAAGKPEQDLDDLVPENSGQEVPPAATAATRKDPRGNDKIILELVGRDGGASLVEIMAATGMAESTAHDRARRRPRQFLGRSVQVVEGVYSLKAAAA